MDIFFQWVLFGYFMSFVGIALLYRTYKVYKSTGVNALKQKPQGRGLKVLASVLKVHFVLVSALVADFSFGLNQLTANKFDWLESSSASIIATVLLLICLPVIILSQVQMDRAWRIEVDNQTGTELITLGLFQYSRNPIFLAIRTGYFAMFLMVPCAYSLAVFMLGDICFQIQVYYEEKALKRVHGDEYQMYCLQVPRWI